MSSDLLNYCLAAISLAFLPICFQNQKKHVFFTAKTVNMDADFIARMVLFYRTKSSMSWIFYAELAGVGKTAIYDIEHDWICWSAPF